MSERIIAGYQLCTDWIQKEITERELLLVLKMALEMVKKEYQRIPVQASSALEHRTVQVLQKIEKRIPHILANSL